MAGNYLTLHTNDRVVVTTSRGNQEKWFDAEKNLWYKVDGGCFEALAEAVSSEVLRNSSKAGTTAGNLRSKLLGRYGRGSWFETSGFGK